MLTVGCDSSGHLEGNMCRRLIITVLRREDVAHTHIVVVDIGLLDKHITSCAHNTCATAMREQLGTLRRLLLEGVLAPHHLVWTALVMDKSSTALVYVLSQVVLLV